MESRIEVVCKEPNPLNEVVITDLSTSYALIHTYEGSTMLDIHLNIKEAHALYEQLLLTLTALSLPIKEK